MLSQHSLLVTAQIDFRGELMGRKAWVIIVDMKWGIDRLFAFFELINYNDIALKGTHTFNAR